MADLKLQMVLTAVDRSAAAMASAGRGVDAFAKKAAGVGKAFTVAGASILAIGGLAVKSSQEQIIGIKRLDQSLKNIGQSYDSQKDKIESLIESQQRKTNFGDEEQRDALQKLVTIGGKWDGVLDALAVTTDVAAGAGIDLKSASLLVGKAIAGETSSLSRYGIVLAKGATQTEIMAALTKQFGGAAEAAADPFTQMKNRMGDVLQILGDALIPIMQKGAVIIEKISRKVIEWTQAHPKLTKVLGIVAVAIGAVMAVLGPLILLLPAIIAGVTALGGALALATGPIGLVVVAIAALVAGIILLWKNWDTVWNGIKKATESAVNFIIDLFNKMTIVHRKALAGMLKAAKAVLDAIPGPNKFGDAMQKAIDKINEGIPKIDIATDTIEKMGEASEKVGEVITKSNEEVIDSYGDLTEAVNNSVEEQSERQKQLSARLAQGNKERVNNNRTSIERIMGDLRQASADRIALADRNALAEEKASQRILDSYNRIRDDLDPVLDKFEEFGVTTTTVIEKWQQVTHQSVDTIIGKLAEMGISSDNLKGVMAAFAEEVGVKWEGLMGLFERAKEKAEEANKAVAGGSATAEATAENRRDIQRRIDDAFRQINELMSQPQTAQRDALINNLQRIVNHLTPQLDRGGVVPGAPGEPRLIMAHGQEVVTPPSRQRRGMMGGGGSLTVVMNLQGAIVGIDSLDQHIQAAFRRAVGGGAFHDIIVVRG